MTRAEAEKLVDERNQQDPDWFCPLINGKCRADCVNFSPAYVSSATERMGKRGMLHDIKDDNFELFGYYCTNAAFVGDNIFPCDER